MANVDCNFDIEKLCFKENSFDYVICNHVLSHVKNDVNALNEIYRVLRRAGKLILTVPINQEIINTIDNSHIGESMRVPITGSADHIRAYGINFENELGKYNFTKVSTYNFLDENGEELCMTYCINPNEDIFIAIK